MRATPILPGFRSQFESMKKGANISHYQILEKLGEGGMGVVYKAQDTKLDRTVALKFLPAGSTPDERDRKRFLQEARAAASLNHPNICSIYSIDEHEGQQFIEMEYIEGRTLRDELREHSAMSPDTFRDYAIQIAKALEAAHRQQIVHRDIKPENIMVDSGGRIKVMDFGLAKLKGMQHFTKSGSTVGTVTYMSPEQMKSEALDERSDLFSFGIVLYEMLTGIHPFKAEYEQALIFNLLNKEPELPSLLQDNISPELEDIVLRCLQKEPENRYHSAEDIRLELEGGEMWPIQKAVSGLKNRSWSGLIHSGSGFRITSVEWVVSAGILLLFIGFLWAYPSTVGLETQQELPEEKYLVVLPFNNLSPDMISQSVSTGIMEVLASKITQMELWGISLWVVPTADVIATDVASVREAMSIFGANMAVTGSLQYAENRLLLTVNLVDGETLRQLRSSVLEMELNDHIGLLDNVVQMLTRMLEVELEPEAMQIYSSPGTGSSEVYRLYIEGKGHLSRFEDASSIESAIDAFREAIERDSSYVRANAALAEAYWRYYELTRDTRWTEEAITYGNRAISLMKEQVPEVYITMALIYNGMGRFDEALAMLENLKGPARNSYQALIEQGKANERLGNPAKAEELYLQAIDRKEHYWGGYNNLGGFYAAQGRLEEAAETFQKVTEVAPDNIRGYNNLGGIYFYLGESDKAVQALRNSITINPNYDALSNLGTYYYFQKDYAEAIRMYEQAIELRQTDHRSWGNLGYAYRRTGRDSSTVRETMQQAIELVEGELEVSPNDPVLLSQLAGYYEAIGNDEACRVLLERLSSTDEMDGDTRISVIHLYEKLGNRDLALEWAEKTLQLGYSLEMLESLEGVDELLNDPQLINLRERYEQEN